MTELPRGWAWATLGEVAATQLGKMLSAKAHTGSGRRPYLRNKNVQWGRIDLDDVLEMDFSEIEFEKFRLNEGDLLVCEGGEVGRAAIWHGALPEIAFQKALHRVRVHPCVLTAYLLYMLRHYAERHMFDAYVTGSTIKHLPQEDLRALPVPLPPLAEQRRIVAAIEEQFSRLDAAEALLNRVRQRLGGLSEVTIAGAVSGSWRAVRLSEITESQIYGSGTKATSGDRGVPMLAMGNIQDRRLVFTKLKYLERSHPDVAKYALQRGDLLFNRTNSPELVGKAAVFKGGLERAIFASYLIRVRLGPECDPDWASLVINGPIGRAYVALVRTQQVGQANVNGTKLANFLLPLPPLEEQRRIVSEVEQRLSVIDALRDAIEAAKLRSAALRRSILELAFTGKLVPQDPDDEPAAALLERLHAERGAADPPHGRRTVRSGR